MFVYDIDFVFIWIIVGISDFYIVFFSIIFDIFGLIM